MSVLSFKNGELVELFSDIVLRLISDLGLSFDAIVPIPSSRAYRINPALERLCLKISRALGVKNGSRYLERIKNVEDSATAKMRPSESEHYETIVFDLLPALKRDS